MKYTPDQYIAYDISRLDNGAVSPKEYFNNAIATQNHAYKEDFADRRFEQACEVMAQTGCCTSMQCENCKLHVVHERAVSDIRSGLRKRNYIPRKEDAVSFTIPGYKVSVSVAGDLDKIVIVMRKQNADAM